MSTRCTCRRPTCRPRCALSWISSWSVLAPAPAEMPFRGKKAHMRATRRFHWLATALAAAVLALASQLALAHGGHHHQQDAAPATGGHAPEAVTAGRAAERPVTAAWTQSCPDGSGGECC